MMATRWEVTEEAIAKDLRPEDFIYLTDGPRQGDRLIAPGHTGKICIGLVAGSTPKLGAELVYEPTLTKTSEGMRVYRMLVRRLEA
jgi:hypothetical protein